MKKKKLRKEDIKRSDGIQVRSVIHRMKMKEVELTIISVFSIIVIIMSAFYIVASSVQEHKDYSALEIGDIEVVFNENKNNIDDIINLTNKNILSDKEGLSSEKYTFEVSNNSKRSDDYVIKIVNDIDMIEADKCLKKAIDRKYIKYSINNSDPKTLGDEEIILKDHLEKKNKKTYDIRIWIDESYTGSDDFHYHGKIIIEEK